MLSEILFVMLTAAIVFPFALGIQMESVKIYVNS